MKSKIIILLTIVIILFFFFGKIDISSILLNQTTNEIKDITGMEVSIDKVSLNFIPLYLEFKNITIFSLENEKLKINKLKLYLGLSRILDKEIEIRRAVINRGDFSLNYSNLNKIVENINNYLKKPTKFLLKLKFDSLEIENLSGSIYNDDLALKLTDFYGRVVLKKEPVISILSNVKLLWPRYSNIDTNLKVFLKIKDNEIVLEELKLFDIDSLVKSSGKINYTNFLGEFLISGKIFFKSLMKFFGIESKGHGELNIDGKVKVIEGQKWHDKLKLNLEFDSSFLLEELMQILKVSEKLSGFTKIFKGKIEGLICAPEITAKVILNKGNILGVKIDKINADASYKNGILEFKNGKANLYNGFANTHVWITLPKVIKHYVFIDIKNVSSNEVFELIHWNPRIADGTITGWLISEGKEFSPRGSFVYVRKGKIPDDVRGKINLIKGDLESVDGVYKFSSLVITLSKTEALVKGYINTKNNYLDFDFVANSRDINELLLPYQKGIYGDIYIKGKLSGNTENPEVNINFSSNSINTLGNEIKEFLQNQSVTFDNLKGNIVYRKNILLINDISSPDISAKGRIFFPEAKGFFDLKNPIFDVLFSVKNIPLKNLYVKALNDVLNTSLEFNGSIKNKGNITVNIVFAPIFLGQHKVIDKTVAHVILQKNSIFIKQLDFYVGGNILHTSGYIDFDGRINLSGKSKDFDITAFGSNYAKKIGMKYIEKINLIDFNFDIKGYMKDLSIKVYTSLITKTKSGRIIDGIVSFNYERNQLIVKSLLMKNISFIVEGLTDKNQWNIKGDFFSARVDPLVGVFINNLPEDLVILVDGKINSSIVEKNLNAQLNLNRIFTRIYGIGLNNKNPVNISVKNGNVYFKPITFIGQSTELTIKGKILDYFDILIEGSTDLRPFKALLKVDDIRGRGSVLMYIYESRKNPKIVGDIDINNASVTLKKNIPVFNNVNAIISFDEDKVLIEKAYGSFSEGTVQMEGTIYLERISIKQIILSGKFSNVRWIFAPRCWAYLDGQLYLTGSYYQPLLSGNVNINRGVYTERFDWTMFALKSNATKTLLAKDSWFNNLKLNLRIQTNNFFVNNNLATANLNSDLLLRGQISEPSLIGWINAKDGWIYFRGNKFDILRFLIQFANSGSIRPYLIISAKTTVAQYNVNLNLNGYIDQFNLILSSNPPLSEQELLNLLVLGQNGPSYRGIPGTSEAVSFITGQMQEVIEERIRGLTGLDVMTVEPVVSKTTGTITPRVTVGKKLMDGKLTVTYSTGTTAEQIIKIEYLIKKGVSLVGTKDEIGGLSGAIKFRFEFH